MTDENKGDVPDTHPSLPDASSSPATARPGMLIGRRWRLERFLDGGGMGTVWEALDLRLEELAAVKLLNPHLVRTKEARERFLREARAAARLRGPNVVSVLDFDIDEGTGAPYMAMELLRGEDLASRLRRGPLGYLQTRSILADVCKAMARAHRLGIVHRDLKPGNIFLCATEEGMVAKVLDFGIAKLAFIDEPGRSITESGRALGTPHYMSPEQISDAKVVDHRADVWALGVIAYQCMVGELPFPGEIAIQVIRKICLELPRAPSQVGPVPEGFDEWFARATELRADARFSTVEELHGAFLSLGPKPEADHADTRPIRVGRSPRARAWVSDANQVDIETIEEVVFKNAVVEEFIEDDRRHFVSGAKGCGKTLLLTYKRARLDARYRGQRAPGASKVTFIPEGRPYLDLMSDIRTVGRSALEFMSSLSNCKRLWGFALRLSALSHVGGIDLPPALLGALTPRLRDVAEREKAEPTVVAKEVLALTVSQIHQLLDQAEMALEHAIRSVHTGLFLFVDKIDQALRGTSRSAWIAMQAGLVEAAWDLMNTNAHVKVFATIREEAFSAYESDIKTNLFGATTQIRYSKEDLRLMLERLTSYYEGLPLRDFVTLDAVALAGTSQSQGAFDFLYRHTLGRPRDLVIIASEISRRRSDLDERLFKSIARETSAGILVANVFDEMKVFLEVLGDRQSRVRFLSSIPYGIMTRDDLIEVWCRFHGTDREYFDSYAEGSGEVFHPFRELYDCGLLGIVSEDPHTLAKHQLFKQPHDPMDAFRYALPRSEVYLLHPSLHALMRRLGIHDGFRTIQDIVVGHDLLWRDHHRLLARVQRELFRAARNGDERGVGHAVRSLLGELSRRIELGEPMREVQREVTASGTFERVCKRLEDLGWDDLHLALLEAFAPGEAIPQRF